MARDVSADQAAGQFLDADTKMRIPTYPAGRSDKIRSVIPGYPAT
jgi:hypothetical protein